MGHSTGILVLSFFLLQASANVLPETISQSPQPTSEEEKIVTENIKSVPQPAQSLEYKPIKPSYQSSGSNIAQIVPPGQPWPASAAGYEGFSQIAPLVAQQSVASPMPISVPAPNNKVIKLDFSKPGVNAVSELQKALAPQLAGANTPSNQQRVISYSLEITPPANSGQDFVTGLQNAIKTVVSQLAPTAGSQMQFMLTKTSSGTIVAVKLSLKVIIPATTQTVVTSNVPEINLSSSSAGLSQSLVNIISNGLTKNGYVAGSNKVQNFNLAFSILPPKGATKDYVKLYVLKPLQAALQQVAPGASVTAVSVNTQQKGNEILKQTVNFSIQTKPTSTPAIKENVINIPTIDTSNSVANIKTILQNYIGKVAAVNPTQQKNLVIPFTVKHPQATNREQIEQMYINPLQNILSQIDPNGRVMKVAAKTTSDGLLELTFYYTLSPSTNEVTGNPLENRFGENEINVTPTKSTILPKPEDLIPKNAVMAPLVDLTKPGADLKDIQVSLDNVLSPSANPDPSKPKILAIPVQARPPTTPVTPEEVQENLVKPVEEYLKKVEPSGTIVTTTTKHLPNGDEGAVFYFEVPSVEKTNTYKNLAEKQPEVFHHDINLDEPGASVSEEVSKTLVSSLVINPKKKDESALIHMNVYTPPNSSPSQIQSVVDDITADLKRQEPTGEVVSTKVNPNPTQSQPDAEVQYFIPSVKDSKINQNANNAISVPTIDINKPGVNLLGDIQNVFKNNAGKLKSDEPQFFNFNFKMNPFNEKGSVDEILKNLKAADPEGKVASYKIKTGDDGLEYLDVVYVLTRKQKPVKETVVDINARKPFENLLTNVISNVNAAVDSLKGVAQKGQVVDIPLNFRLTNTKGLSDSQISKIISQFYPSLKNYVSQALPDGQILSSKTICPPNSDDVILRLNVRTPYDPDDVIIIEEVHKKRTTTTTERTGIFGFKIFG